jgi:hypothetical protein
MTKWEPVITDKIKKDILALFYRTKLYHNETVIDNMDSTIARELGLKTGTVGNIIAVHLTEKFNTINKKINQSLQQTP